MDIIKITGAAVVLMSSFMLGMYFVVVNKTRIKNLADIDETWRTISAEIRFQSGSLPEIFKRFASYEYSFGIKALYKDVYENMVVDSEKAAFDIIWRESVRNNASKSCFLREEDFLWAIETFYYSAKKLSLRSAYDMLLLSRYTDADGLCQSYDKYA